MSLFIFLLCEFFLDYGQGSRVGPPVPKMPYTMPFNQFLLQEPAFQVENALEESGNLPAISSVPLVMKILYEQAERISNRETLPQNGDFQSLAHSVQPINIEEYGLQRVILDFPSLTPDDLKPGSEAWLVFHLIPGNNCSQVLTVYENRESKMRPVANVALTYKNEDPLLMVNITRSLRGWRLNQPSYVIVIKDSTSYTRDQHLYSFSNYIDCSLTRAWEVLELHDIQSSPVLLLLSPELSAKGIMQSQGPYGRFRRNTDSSEDTTSEESQRKSQTTKEEDMNCHFKEWAVNIEQLGWDWLVYPERIPLNLCLGKCPVLLDRHFNATSHAVARGLHRLVLGQESKPENRQPCCVPVKYRKFTMLIEKAPGVISLETSSDLSASQCGCR